MAVKVTGTILASLLYDNSSSFGNQVGLLLGEVVREVKDTISDSQINNVEVETKIYVYESVAWPNDLIFHDRRGQVDMDEITKLLGDKTRNIVGWYSFRRNSSPKPSFRERLIHASLVKSLNKEGPLFTFLLCSEKTNKPTLSLHKHDHCFLHCVANSVFRKPPETVINLGDTTHTEYRLNASHTVSQTRGTYSSIIRHYEKDGFNPVDQVNKIQTMNGAITQRLNHIQQSFLESENIRCDLEKEVEELREMAIMKKLELEHRNRPVEAARGTGSSKTIKQPSVDELLCMDDSDSDVPSPSLVSGHDLMHAVCPDTENYYNVQSDKRDHSHISQPENKPVSKLSTPVIHLRSRSSPVDIVTSQSQVTRTRSRSGDSHDAKKTEQCKQDDANEFGNQNFSKSVGKMPADPFDFVNKELKASSKSVDNLTSNRFTGHSKAGNHHTTGRIETRTHSTNKHGASAREDVVNPLYEMKKQVEGTSGVSKNCRKEATSQHLNNDSNKDSSQDTYDMDVSSSPVY
ncbi:BRCA1-A complex subunit Abraxas 1-like [Mya arenaria]|uniref:BRCA1-A complex subunit Abraxas 1-like n=1 Tax=Mya arenaria TaxID=6604 RepID=UPI0022E650E6|nr:BRCA1-A complex subunit Abraxas 1-like [Mya arenaria]